MTKLNDTQIKFKTLTSLYGANNLSKKILITRLGTNSRLNYNYIKEKKFNQLNTIINKQLIGKKLQESVRENISFIKNIKTYKGLRHRASLPVRGQRTHTNAKTCKKKSRKKTF
jgi:small subunit ribosomal protein S13